MNLKRWAASIQAQKQFSTYTSVKHAVVVLLALNSDEAVGVAMRGAFENWPSTDGWTSHSVVVCDIDKDLTDAS